MLFEVAVIQKPTKKEAEENGAVEQLIFGPKAVTARDSQTAAIQAVLSHAQPIDLTRAEVIVRPFS